jgi:hypothetical protein
LYCSSIHAQEAFYKTYAGSSFDEGHGIAQLADSGYIITGSTAGFSEASDVFLTRLNKFGEFEWSKKIGGANSDRGKRVFYEEGVGFWGVGYSNSLTAQSFDFYMFKTDLNGQLEWETVMGTSDWDRVHDAIRLPNGDFMLVGETQGALSQQEDILVMRVDAAGNQVWMERVQTSGSDIPHAISLLNDTTVIIAGESFNGTNQAALLMSMHTDGSTNWMNFYEPSLRGTFYDVDTYDNNIYAVGGLIAATESLPDLWMIRTDKDGVLIYDHLDVRDSTAYFGAVEMMGDGRLYVSIISDSPSFTPFTDGMDMFVLKYHQNLFWNGFSSSYSGVNDDVFHQIIPTNDNGVALIGTVSDNRVINTPGTQVTVVKIGENDEFEAVPSSDELVSIVEMEDVEVAVFPNPMKDVLTVQTAYSGPVDFVLSNPTGQLIQTGRIVNGKIDVSSLSSGVYLLTFQLNGQVRTIRVIK